MLVRRTIGSVVSLFLLAIGAGAAYGEAGVSSADKLIPIKVSRVKVAGEIGRRIDVTMRNNLLAFDADSAFLSPFRERSRHRGGSHLDRYIGLGKLIDAAVHFAAYSNDEEIITFKGHLVAETIKTQLPDGYIGIFRPEERIRTYWDVHEMVYVLYGLVSDYREFGNDASLEAARKLADYIVRNRPATPALARVKKLNLERAFIALFQATGQRHYLVYAAHGVDGKGLRNWHEPVKGHAYTFMNLCMAQLDLYDIERDESLLAQSRRVCDFVTKQDGLLISGAVSRSEGWHSDQNGSGRAGETCATAYLIRLMNRMLCVEGKSLYGDIMERAIYNALFAAQSPDGRHLRYFCPTEGRREYFETKWQAGHTSMIRVSEDTYCCPNNFRRIIARLTSMIYYRSDGGLAINLYGPSSATVTLEDDVLVKVRQETDYPNGGAVTICLDPSAPVAFPLRLRIPRWCANARVKVNGKALKQTIPSGSFLTIERQFKAGDRVELVLPMEWRLVRGRKTQDGLVAVMRGPLLFGLNPQRNGARQEDAFRNITIDPSSLTGPVRDEMVRPDGLACYVQAWSNGRSLSEPADLRLMLTEFADPGTTATYFRSSGAAVDDELACVP